MKVLKFGRDMEYLYSLKVTPHKILINSKKSHFVVENPVRRHLNQVMESKNTMMGQMKMRWDTRKRT